MFIIRFFKSLFMPSKMVKYGKMNFIIAIAIFLISSGLLALPNSIYLSNHRYDLVDLQDSYHLQVFTKLDNDDLLVLRQSTCTVEDQAMSGICSGHVLEGEPYIYEVTYQEKTTHIHIVFDLYDIHDAEASPTYNIQTQFNTLPTSDGGNYLLVFYRDGIYYQTPESISGKELAYANGHDFALSELTDGTILAYRLIDMYMNDIRMEITFNTFLICVIYTLIFIIVMWLVYKTTQTPYTFKEMYNIGAISSIVPLIVIIVTTLLFPRETFMFYYITVFGLYYVIVLYRISKLKKLV